MPTSPNIVTRETYTNQQTVPPGGADAGWGYWDSMAVAPSAAAYGVGSAWIGGIQYWSDGKEWIRRMDYAQRVALIGDSMTMQNKARGFLLNAQSPSLPTSLVYAGTETNMPVGTGTLLFTAASKTLQWKASGENYGAAVVVDKSGQYLIKSSVLGHGIYIGVLASSLPTSDASYSLTFIASAHQQADKSFGFANWTRFLSGGAIEVVENQGVSGAKLIDIYQSLERLDGIDFDSAVFMGGTNDISVTSIATMQSTFNDILAYFERRNVTLYVLPIPPRGSSTSAIAYAASAFNRFLEYACDRSNFARFVPANLALTDRTSTVDNAISGALYDGLHPAPVGAYLIGKTLNSAIPDGLKRKKFAPVTYGGIYHATDNPQGNLIPAAASVWEGTSGTVNTGVTTTSGVPTGINCRRESGSTAVVGTVDTAARASGNGKDLVIAVTTAASGEAIRVENTSGITSGLTAGERLTAYADFTVTAQTSLQTLTFTVLFSTSDGQTFYYYGTGQAYSTYPLFPSGELPSGRIVIPDLIVPALVTNMSFRISVGCLTGGSATVKVGDIFIGRVV